MGGFYEKRIEGGHPDPRYLVTIARNGGRAEVEVSKAVYEALDDMQREHWRLERRESRHSSHMEVVPERYLPRSAFGKSSEQILIEQFEAEEMKEALRSIPALQQRRFLMRYLIGLPIKQIASIEGCSDRAVKYSIAVARKNLRKLLSE